MSSLQFILKVMTYRRKCTAVPHQCGPVPKTEDSDKSSNVDPVLLAQHKTNINTTACNIKYTQNNRNLKKQ